MAWLYTSVPPYQCYLRQRCSRYCRFVSMQTTELFKTFQDVIVPERPAVLCSMHIVEDCSGPRSITLFTHRICRLESHRIPPPNDEPCRQSCAARGRPRLSYREHHWIAPVRLAAAQSSPWLRPATYRPSRIDTANDAEPRRILVISRVKAAGSSTTVEVPLSQPCFEHFFRPCFRGHDEAGLLAFEAPLRGSPRPARGQASDAKRNGTRTKRGSRGLESM